MKKWFIALLFVFACLPVVAIKAAPPQTYIHLEYEVIDGEYNIGDGRFEGRPGWRCSNKIQIHKNVDKLYFSGQLTHFILFYNDETYIGYYYDEELVSDLTWEVIAEERILGDYTGADGFQQEFDKPTNATHIVLQSCVNPTAAGLEDHIVPMPYYLSEDTLLIYYPAPADAAANITFNLMPALMIMLVIAGITGGLIMITKKSKR